MTFELHIIDIRIAKATAIDFNEDWVGRRDWRKNIPIHTIHTLIYTAIIKGFEIIRDNRDEGSSYGRETGHTLQLHNNK